jgi:CSLREA domain-containing protein
MDTTAAYFVLGLENDDPTYRRAAIIGQNGQLIVQYHDGTAYRTPANLITPTVANTWYVLTLTVDDSRALMVDVYQENDPSKHSTYTVPVGGQGKRWLFHAWTYSGTLYLDDYQEFHSGIVYTPDDRMSFTYDALDRLTSAYPLTGTLDGYTAAYTYTAIGNLQNKNEPTGALAYTYGNSGASGCVAGTLSTKPHAVTQAGSNSYAYDCNGNMTTRIEAGVTYSQTFDIENRLTVVTNTTTGEVTRFVYDGDGARVLQLKPDGSKTAYINALMEVAIPASAPSSTYAVTKFSDSNDGACNSDCSLREAVIAANANANPDTIVLAAGTYTLTRTGEDSTASNGDLDITNPLTLTGAGANLTIIAGGSGFTDRIFHVFTGTVQINHLTIRNGNRLTLGGGGVRVEYGRLTLGNSVVMSNTAATDGGGILLLNSAVLTLTNSAVFSNTASDDGGGLSNSYTTLTLVNSAVYSNTALDNGGGVFHEGGVTTISNTTLSGNQARYDGGGLAVYSGGTATLMNATVFSNTADSDSNGTGNGGGLNRTSGTVTAKNTAFAGNVDTGGQAPDCSGALTSQGYNHLQSTTGCTFTPTTGDQTGAGAQLNLLANNGGATLSHLPQSGSPVIDGGSACAAADQRGYGRSGVCDKGAVEYNGLASSPGPTQTVTKTYYYAGAQLVAMREITSTASTLYFLHSDHLGSTSLTTDANGAVLARQS